MELDTSALDGIQIEGTQETKKKGVVDIVFLLDISGSMGPAIAQVGKNIATFVQNLKPEEVKDWRVRVMSFGDLEKDSPELSLNINRPFTQNAQEIVNQIVECIDLVKQAGGGDEPESSLDALYLAAKDGFDAPWSERTRTVIVFTDASPKKILKETIGIDADGVTLLSQMINDNHVYVHLFAPIHDDYKTLKNNCGKYVNYVVLNENGSNPVEALKNIDFSEALKTLGKSVSQASLIS